MPRSDDLQKHTLNLFEGDYEKLQSYYPDVGAGPIIRRVVRSFLEQIEKEGVGNDINVEVKI
jgi:hypothetical protein